MLDLTAQKQCSSYSAKDTLEKAKQMQKKVQKVQNACWYECWLLIWCDLLVHFSKLIITCECCFSLLPQCDCSCSILIQGTKQNTRLITQRMLQMTLQESCTCIMSYTLLISMQLYRKKYYINYNTNVGKVT